MDSERNDPGSGSEEESDLSSVDNGNIVMDEGRVVVRVKFHYSSII